jgi:hydroxyethylthiazole kinase-like uncharacterized protein yjeF
MEILTSEQMKKVDEETINRFCPGLELMERAGRQVAEFVLDTFGVERIKAAVFAGAGNNGGDAFVVARHLIEAGCSCSIHRLKSPDSFSMDALKNYERLQRLDASGAGFKEFDAQRPDWPRQVEKDLEDATIIIDGLFGTGIRGALRGTAVEMVRTINSSRQPVVSIDIPSGVDGDSGAVAGIAVRAAYTLTIGRPKLGLLFHPGKEHAGEMIVADIGFPEEVVQAHASGLVLLDTVEAAGRVPARPPTAHKYRCGTLLIVAGSGAYTGAAVLAAEAALRGGCGMVFVGVPEGVRPVVDAGAREAITIPLPETGGGTIALPALETLRPYLEKADALAVGPGIGRDPETDEVVRALVKASGKPLVLDADGIHAFAGTKDLLSAAGGPVVITPHSGELSRLLDAEIAQAPMERIEQTRQIAAALNLVVLHKGAPSIIASPRGELLINLHGNSALATGGTGDVLTGFVGSFLAQGASVLDAAGIGSFLLGRSGELASFDMGVRGVIAGDLLAYSGMAMLELEESLPGEGV